MNQETTETKETKPFVINPDDVAAGRIYICRNGARVKLELSLAAQEGRERLFIWRIKDVLGAGESGRPDVGWSYTLEGCWVGPHSPDSADIICLETLAEPEITPVKPKPTPRKSFIRTGVIKSVRTQKDGNYTVTVDMTDTPDTGIRRIVLNLPSSKLKAHQRVGFSFRTNSLITDKTEFAECTLEN